MGRELPFLARVPGRTHGTLGPARSSPWHAQRLHGRQNWFACSRGVDCVRGPGAQLGYVPAMQHMDCHMDGATFLPDDLVECLAPQLVKPLKLFSLSLTGTPRRWCCAQKRHDTWC